METLQLVHLVCAWTDIDVDKIHLAGYLINCGGFDHKFIIIKLPDRRRFPGDMLTSPLRQWDINLIKFQLIKANHHFESAYWDESIFYVNSRFNPT